METKGTIKSLLNVYNHYEMSIKTTFAAVDDSGKCYTKEVCKDYPKDKFKELTLSQWSYTTLCSALCEAKDVLIDTVPYTPRVNVKVCSAMVHYDTENDVILTNLRISVVNKLMKDPVLFDLTNESPMSEALKNGLKVSLVGYKQDV